MPTILLSRQGFPQIVHLDAFLLVFLFVFTFAFAFSKASKASLYSTNLGLVLANASAPFSPRESNPNKNISFFSNV